VSVVLLGCGGGDGDDSSSASSPDCAAAPEDGTEQLFRVSPGPTGDEPTAQEVSHTVEILCQRMYALGIDETGVEVIEGDPPHLRVVLPKRDVNDEYSASVLLSSPGRVHFYAWEANVVPNPNAPVGRAAESPFKRIDQAVRFAATQKPECFHGSCTTGAASYWLLLADEPERASPLGVARSKRELFANQPAEVRSEKYELLTVPRGTRIVYIEPPQGGPLGWYVLRDRPALSGEDITNPEESVSPVTNEPNVTFQFTPQGEAAFAELTKDVAGSGRRAAPPGVAADPVTATQFAHSFALVLDHEVAARPIVNFAENPTGISGSNGVSIEGNVGDKDARDIAIILETGPLPAALEPVVALP
jgi:SecD/SecF fusion protein